MLWQGNIEGAASMGASAVSDLIDLMNGPLSRDAVSAILGMGDIGVRELCRMLDDGISTERVGALSVLEKERFRGFAIGARDALARAARDENKYLRRGAVRLLRKLNFLEGAGMGGETLISKPKKPGHPSVQTGNNPQRYNISIHR